MEWIDKVSCIKARVDPLRFLKLLTSIAKRVESGRNDSISLSECQKWGFSGEEVVPYLFLLVEVGILKHRIQVYDHEDDAFEDYIGQYPGDSVEDSQVKIWFKPELTGESFSSFFCVPPADNGGQIIKSLDASEADNNFTQPIFQFLTVNNLGTFTMHSNATTNSVTTGDVDHGMVGANISKSSAIHDEAGGNKRKPFHGQLDQGIAPLLLLIFGVSFLLFFTCLSMFDFKFSSTTISFIQLVFSIMIAPYLGTMAGKVIFSFNSKDDNIPIAFKATGILAVFLGTLLVLKIVNIPMAN